MTIEINLGKMRFRLQVPSERIVTAQRIRDPHAIDGGKAVADAITTPLDFPPLRQALTPDDHIALVLERWAPSTRSLLEPIVDHLRQSGVRDENITIVALEGEAPPSSLGSLGFEVHNGNDKSNLEYVATTKAGRRIYLNRTTVDADQIIVLSEVRYHHDGGVTGGPLILFPGLADDETRAAIAPMPSAARRAESEEVSWLLGLPFFVCWIAGVEDGVSEVIAGPTASFAAARRALSETWKHQIDRLAQTVVAPVRGPALADLVMAARHASVGVERGGTIIVVAENEPPLDDEFEKIREAESPEAALRHAATPLATRWLKLVCDYRVAVCNAWPAELVEELFAIPLQNEKQIQRLIDAGGDVLVLPDADRARIASPATE